MTRARKRAERRGRRGEAWAVWYLRLKGWRILGQRLRTPRGEVDIIGRRWRTLCFFEVKWRSNGAQLADAIDSQRLRRIAAAAEVLAPRFVRAGDLQRIDVVLLAPGQFPRHIVNAWMP